MAITLVPEAYAKPGARFTFRGPNDGKAVAGTNTGEECAACPFTKLCFGLVPGRTYEVSAKRGVTHPCELHEGGRVHVVTVEQTDMPSTVETRLLRGTAAHWTPIPCGRPDCANYALCHPVGPAPGAKYAITEQAGRLECPAGYELTRVRLKMMD